MSTLKFSKYLFASSVVGSLGLTYASKNKNEEICHIYYNQLVRLQNFDRTSANLFPKQKEVYEELITRHEKDIENLRDWQSHNWLYKSIYSPPSPNLQRSDVINNDKINKETLALLLGP